VTETVLTWRAILSGRRGRLLAGLLLAELAAAVQSIAYSSVLPLASAELDGSALYGATLAAGTLTTILVLASGRTFSDARRALFAATGLYVVGVLLAATAPAMALVLLGNVVRGAGGGLLAGFGLSAIGGLYDDAARRRVVGLFALIWLVPSIAGPPVNGVIAASLGWRWALVWPGLVLLAARVLIARHADLVPWSPSQGKIDPRLGLAVVAGIVLASAAPGPHAWTGALLLVGGVTLATVAAARTVGRLLGPAKPLAPTLLVFFGLTLAFFGGHGLISLAVIDGLGHGVVAGSVALGAGLVAWSLLGLRPAHSPGLVAPALFLLALALAAVALSQALSGAGALVVIVGAWTCAGAAMGTAYPWLFSAPFDALPQELVTPVATAAVFAELAGTSVGGLVGGGWYSLATAAGTGPRPAIAAGCIALAGVAVLAGAAHLATRCPTSGAG
jgi:MFS family permease